MTAENAESERAGRTSRSKVKGNIHLFTDYSVEKRIFLHKENSYRSSWARLLPFHCVQETATTRLAAPSADPTAAAAA
ncbi:hypothetical protein [Streptomyces sp. NPDC048516]|uniref:hypothetical protein n=1 Tax=Streptomyces sp. NPDC048516 TaxID=3365565 RepID=UPI00371B81B7